MADPDRPDWSARAFTGTVVVLAVPAVAAFAFAVGPR
jgi:hypothetical protein